MYKWVQKEFFFFATLAFIFVATAGVSSFFKSHLHNDITLASTARVFWPDNQAAIYPQRPPESFFLAQKKSKEKSKEKITQASSPSSTLAHRPPTRVAYAYPSYKKAQRKQAFRRKKVTPQPKKTAVQPSRQSQKPRQTDTLNLRAYDVHMKWVKKTLAEYREPDQK